MNARAFHEMLANVGDFPDSIPEPPSEKSRRAWSEDAANRFTYEQNCMVAGHGHLEKNEISSVSVEPNMQGQGIGERLFKRLCNEVYDRGYDEAALWCVIGNHAKRLYDHRLGFQERHITEFAAKLPAYDYSKGPIQR